MINIRRSKGWMKRTGGWYSDIWNYFANIQELITGQGTPITRFRIYTVKMVNADEEYEQALPANTRTIEIQTTDGTPFRLSMEVDRVAPARRPYWSVPVNTSWGQEKLNLTGATLFFASSTANKTIEIMIGT